jgi:glucose/arabinose dehydrogenase
LRIHLTRLAPLVGLLAACSSDGGGGSVLGLDAPRPANETQIGDEAEPTPPGPEDRPIVEVEAEAERPPTIEGNLFVPEQREFDEARLTNLRLPEGFRIHVVASGLENVRQIAEAEDGTLYVSRRLQKDVLALRDTDGDGRIDEQATITAGIDNVNGLILHDGRLYIAPPKQVLVADRADDGTVSEFEVFVDDLPDGGQHPNRTMAVSPDGDFFVSVGSSCNSCRESNEEHATLLRFDRNGGSRTIFAEGLRNTIGFAWHPDTGELWGMDHGTDWRGDDAPPEELNRIREGRHYGWPFCWGDREVDRYIPLDPLENGTEIPKESFCPTTEPPVLMYQAHSSPLGLVFYTGEQFPSEYRGDAFITMRGSWNRYPAVGYKVVRVRFENGQPREFVDFVDGFLIDEGRAFFGRPSGILVSRDGSLLFTDDTGGVIYRVSYVGDEASP